MYTETTPKHTLLQCGQPIQLNEARKPLCQRLRNFTLEQARVITPDQEKNARFGANDSAHLHHVKRKVAEVSRAEKAGVWRWTQSCCKVISCEIFHRSFPCLKTYKRKNRDYNISDESEKGWKSISCSSLLESSTRTRLLQAATRTQLYSSKQHRAWWRYCCADHVTLSCSLKEMALE